MCVPEFGFSTLKWNLYQTVHSVIQLEEEGGAGEEGDAARGTGAPPSVFADTVP